MTTEREFIKKMAKNYKLKNMYSKTADCIVKGTCAEVETIEIIVRKDETYYEVVGFLKGMGLEVVNETKTKIFKQAVFCYKFDKELYNSYILVNG